MPLVVMRPPATLRLVMRPHVMRPPAIPRHVTRRHAMPRHKPFWMMYRTGEDRKRSSPVLFVRPGSMRTQLSGPLRFDRAL